MSLMRMGAAAAAAVIVVFVAQYALLPGKPTQSDQAGNNEQARPHSTQPPDTPVPPSTPEGGAIATATPPGNMIDHSPSRNIKRASSRIDPDLAALDPHLVIVRGERGDREVPIFTVSVGAQPHLYGTSSAPQARLAKASF